MTRLARRRALPLFVLLCAAPLGAQAADSAAFPPIPWTTPRPLRPVDPADSGFAAWRRIPLPPNDRSPAAWNLRAGDWDFLIATPRAMDALAASRLADSTLANCVVPLGISEADSAVVAQARPWAPFDSLASDRPALVISIMPVLRNVTECGFKSVGRPAIIFRGLRFVTDYAYDPAHDPASAVLVSGARIVRATMLARAPIVMVARNGIPRTPTGQLRLYIPYDAIAPAQDGELPRAELVIWPRAGGAPARIPLPADIMHAVWWDYLRWRAERLAARDRATIAAPPSARRVIVSVPTPSDAGLKTAQLRQREGHDAEAGRIMLERLADTKLSMDDRRIALMELASTFQADDDAPAAALVANELTSIDPCAMAGNAFAGNPAPTDEANASLREAGALLAPARRGVRCTAASPGATFLRGLLVPGLGQYTTTSRVVGVAVSTLVLSGAIVSISKLTQSNSLYSRYQADRSAKAPQIYTLAQDRRFGARELAIETGAFWAASAIEAGIQERSQAARVAAERDFWLRPLLVRQPETGDSELGVGAGLTIRFR